MSDYYLSRGNHTMIFHREHVEDDAIERGHMRPVVVIDPEDDAAVRRLVELLGDHGWRPTTAHGLQEALREFAAPTPPRPEEPTGLGAVVEDAEGFQWVRIDDRRWYCEARGYRHYAEIDVAGEPLSEGVTE